MIKRAYGAETLSPLPPLLLLPLGSCNSCSMCKAPPITDTHTVCGLRSLRLHDERGQREEACASYRVTSYFSITQILHLCSVCLSSRLSLTARPPPLPAAITEQLSDYLFSLQLARAGIMCLYGAGTAV